MLKQGVKAIANTIEGLTNFAVKYVPEGTDRETVRPHHCLLGCKLLMQYGQQRCAGYTAHAWTAQKKCARTSLGVLVQVNLAVKALAIVGVIGIVNSVLSFAFTLGAIALVAFVAVGVFGIDVEDVLASTKKKK